MLHGSIDQKECQLKAEDAKDDGKSHSRAF